MSSSVRTKRAFATGLAVVMTGGGLAAVAAPAQSATDSVIYSCTAPGQTFDLSVIADSDAPAKMYVGESVTPVITAATALPGSLAQARQALGAESFDGTVLANGALNGTPVPVSQTIPTTALGAQTTPTNVEFTASGPAPLPLKPGAPGDLVLTAGDFDATFNFKAGDGTAVGDPIAAACKAPTNNKTPIVDTIVVVSKSSTTLTLSPTTAGYGAPVTATAKVTTPGGTPDGDVTFVVGGVSTKVKVKDGAASLVIDRAVVGTHAVSATFTPKDATHYEGSSATPANLKVSKAATSTRFKITGKRVRERTAAAIKVVGINKTVPTGKVKLVLRKAGNRGFHKVKRGKLANGTRGFNLGRLGKGRYKVVVKYKGDANHRTSKTVKRFRVRR